MGKNDLEILPKHIGIIMDGNRRWAREKGLKDFEGHEKGFDNLITVLELLQKQGVDVVTVYALSNENLNKRSPEEVKHLIRIIKTAVTDYLPSLQEKGVEVSFIGDIGGLPTVIRTAVSKVLKVVVPNPKMKVNIAINYGSRQEIIMAIKSLLKDKVNPSEVTEELITSRLYTKNDPDPDLLIRTGKQKRISNFLLWQISYAELYFTDTYWPDFDEKELLKALEFFKDRQRNFGA